MLAQAETGQVVLARERVAIFWRAACEKVIEQFHLPAELRKDPAFNSRRAAGLR